MHEDYVDVPMLLITELHSHVMQWAARGVHQDLLDLLRQVCLPFLLLNGTEHECSARLIPHKADKQSIRVIYYLVRPDREA